MVTSNHHFRGPDWGVKWRGKYQNLAPQSPVKIVLERNLAHPITATSNLQGISSIFSSGNLTGKVDLVTNSNGHQQSPFPWPWLRGQVKRKISESRATITCEDSFGKESSTSNHCHIQQDQHQQWRSFVKNSWKTRKLPGMLQSLQEKFISAVLQQEFILKTACAVVITKKNSCCQTRSIQQNDSQRACTLNAQWMENNQPERYQRRILMPQPLPRYSERLSWKV